jgi:glycosyltransferase involved in cell wall biosynthesis
MKQPTIWIINQFAGTPDSGWGERHYFLSEKFKNEGFRVFIISSGNNHMFRKKAEMKGLFTMENYNGTEFCWVNGPSYNPQSISRFGAMFFFALALLWLPFKRTKIGKPDYILLSSMSIFPVPSVVFLKKILGAKKFIFEVRDLWPLTPIHLMGYSPKHPAMRLIGWLERLGYRKADEIVSLLKESENYITEISGKREKFTWIPNGIFQSDLENATTTEAANVAIPANRLVIAYMGTISFANALDPLIELILSQQEIENQVYFLFIGDGYLKDKYKDQLVNVNNVAFLNKVPKNKVQSYLKLADVCFIAWHHSPLYEYGVSANKYYDYLASGNPVLAAQIGIKDVVKESGCGIVVANTADEIRNGIVSFLETSEIERQKMGALGRNYVSRFSYDRLSEDYLRIILRD